MSRFLFILFVTVNTFFSNAQIANSLSAKEAVIIALEKNYSIQISKAQKEIATSTNTKIIIMGNSKNTPLMISDK